MSDVAAISSRPVHIAQYRGMKCGGSCRHSTIATTGLAKALSSRKRLRAIRGERGFNVKVRMSRNAPAAVTRQLRQEAGFGCCVCGVPILQYHHIVKWSEDQHFRPEDMMVLCPLHHDQATKGAMPELEQRRLKANPHNIQNGFAKGLLAVRQDYCAANFGSVTMVGEGPFIRIDGEDMLSFYIGEGNLVHRFQGSNHIRRPCRVYRTKCGRQDVC